MSSAHGINVRRHSATGAPPSRRELRRQGRRERGQRHHRHLPERRRPGRFAVPRTGHSLINAADIDLAVATAHGCPFLANGGSVEVAEAIDM
jgi:hypothetical protein